MKRYDGYILRFINHEGGAKQQEPAEVYLASEVDEVIMNMVNEFAETAKEYEAELAKKDEEFDDAMASKNRFLNEKDEEITRLKDCLINIRDKTLHKQYAIEIAREALAEKE